MKVAVLISGYLRSFKDNIESLKTHLFLNASGTLPVPDANIFDIYIHITQSDETKYLNNNFKLDEIYKHFKPKLVLVSDNIQFENDNQNLYNQNYKYWLLNKNRQEIEKTENIKYDIVLKIRPDVNLQENILDLCFVGMLPELRSSRIPTDVSGLRPPTSRLMQEGQIYIPSDSKMDKSKLNNKDDPYLCDIIAYGPPHLMDKYFDIYRELDALIPKYGAVNETLLYHHITNNQIPYQLIDIKYIVILSQVNTIAITGDSGCGKTNLSNILKRLFDNSFILECDRYHKWERNDEKWKTITHLNPEANYITKMNNDVFDLKLGRNIYQVDYDHETGKFTDKQLIENKENIIVCGLHTLYITDNIIDLKIFIEATDSVRIPWKIKRDIAKRGYTIERILKQIEDRKSDYENFILPQRANADIVISFYNENQNQFDINTFNPDADVEFEYKIGINRNHCCDLNCFLYKSSDIAIKRIEPTASCVDCFHWLYFDNVNFENIITNIILQYLMI